MENRISRRGNVREKDVLELIGSAYDASVDASGWPGFVRKLSDLHGGSAVGIFSESGPDHSDRLSYSVRLDPALEDRYEEDFSAINVFGETLKTLREEEIIPGCRIISDTALTATQYYADWMAPQDMFHTLHSVVMREDANVVRLAVGRAKSAGKFDETEVKVWKEVIPHLRRAVRIRKLNSELYLARNVMDEGLSRRSVGLLLVGADGTVVDTNSFAERLLEKGDGLTVRSRKLVTERKRDQDRLDALIHYTIKESRPEAHSDSNLLYVSRPSGREPYKILIAPGRVAVPFLDKRTSAAVVYITDPETDIVLNASEFREAYGFTDAESRVALLIVRGLDVNSVARELRVSKNTVRTHLKRVFEKTDTKKQSHLVLKVLTETLW